MSRQELQRPHLIEALLAVLTMVTGQSVLFSQAIADQVGLNPTDLEALEVLLRQGPLTAGKLAEITGLTTGAITGVVDRLERKGYARRETDPGDRRRVIVRATSGDATQALLALYGGMGQATLGVMAQFEDDDLAVILAFLQAAKAVAAEQIEQIRSRSDPGPAPR
ncbi:MAG: MarR family transcriptional regulator [Chloroflexota bacterium]|nr:MarR family transcriptional regulator [Chloroflexota bacterium]